MLPGFISSGMGSTTIKSVQSKQANRPEDNSLYDHKRQSAVNKHGSAPAQSNRQYV